MPPIFPILKDAGIFFSPLGVTVPAALTANRDGEAPHINGTALARSCRTCGAQIDRSREYRWALLVTSPQPAIVERNAFCPGVAHVVGGETPRGVLVYYPRFALLLEIG